MERSIFNLAPSKWQAALRNHRSIAKYGWKDEKSDRPNKFEECYERDCARNEIIGGNY